MSEINPPIARLSRLALFLMKVLVKQFVNRLRMWELTRGLKPNFNWLRMEPTPFSCAMCIIFCVWIWKILVQRTFLSGFGTIGQNQDVLICWIASCSIGKQRSTPSFAACKNFVAVVDIGFRETCLGWTRDVSRKPLPTAPFPLPLGGGGGCASDCKCNRCSRDTVSFVLAWLELATCLPLRQR